MPTKAINYHYTSLGGALWNKAEKEARRYKNDTVYPIHYAFALFNPDLGASDPDYDSSYDSNSDSGSDCNADAKDVDVDKDPSVPVPFCTASFSAAIARVGGDAASIKTVMEELVRDCLPVFKQEKRHPTCSPDVNDMIQLADKIRKSRHDAFIAPHHVLLALLRAPDISCVIAGASLDLTLLEKTIIEMRGKRRVYRKKEGTSIDHHYLDKYCTDLTALADANKIMQAIDREDESRRLIRILSRKSKHTPCLVGEPGIGKTAIAEDLARRVVLGRTPLTLCGIVLKLSEPCAKSSEKTGCVIQEIREVVQGGEAVIVLLDDLDLAARNECTDKWIELLQREPSVRCFGTASRKGWEKYVAGNLLLQRQVVEVAVEEPGLPSTVSILNGVRGRYEAHHDVKIPDEVLETTAKLAHQYIRDRPMPDKAIDLLDEACAHASIMRTSTVSEGVDDAKVTLGAESVAEVVAKWTKIPVSQLLSTEKEILLRLEVELMKSVVGQSEAVKAVSNAIRLSRSGLGNKQRPIASFLFAGATGTGKTFLTKTLAKLLFHDAEAMIRIDCSEYTESHSVARLIGSPPGYVGYESGGQLTEYVRKKPFCIVLLDELEKAHKKFLTIFLQVLDDGRLTDGQGTTVDFTNTCVIMTSNIGAAHLKDVTGRTIPPAARKLMTKALEDALPPEFINRLDDVIIFRKLTHDNIKGIINVRLREIEGRLSEQKLTLEISPEAKAALVDKGYSPVYGARPLNRIIQQELLNPLSIMLLSDQIVDGEVVKVGFDTASSKLTIQGNHPGTQTHMCVDDDEEPEGDDWT